MNQFYVKSDQIDSSRISLTGQEAIHASKVLRKGTGEEIFITDGNGHRYQGLIESVSRGTISIHIRDIQSFRKPEPSVILAMGMIRKRNRLEFAVEKAVELGVSEIILFRGDHSEPFKVRMDRAEASALSAMKQSLRVYLPPVKSVDSLDDIIRNETDDATYIYADQEGEIDEYDLSPNIKRAVLVIGPEGGLSDREEGLLKETGATGLHLGDYRLRAETAAVVMALKYGHAAEVPA